jgi:hypothetical protein
MTINDFIKQNLQLATVQSEYICRFRTFILNFSTFTSAWVLVLISMDRLVRVCFPYQQQRLCTRKIAALSVGIMCICSTLSTCHVLQQEFAFVSPNSNICGPSRSVVSPYTIFYFNI